MTCHLAITDIIPEQLLSPSTSNAWRRRGSIVGSASLSSPSEPQVYNTRVYSVCSPALSSVNMDGTALFVTVASIFIAQMNNIPLNAADYVTVV